jgi:hypothetical protein
MGLGITHLATGATKLIQHRDEVKFYLPHTLWTVNILLLILLIWWGMFSWSDHNSWYAFEYLFITLYAIVAFFLASMLYPWDMAKNIDVREFFFKNRIWFFSALLVAWCIDGIETIIKADAGLRLIPQGYFGFLGVQILIALTGIGSRNRFVHTALSVIFFASLFILVLFSAQNQIST